MVMIDGKEYQKKEMLLKNTKYNSALIEYEYLLDKLEALKLKIIDKQTQNIFAVGSQYKEISKAEGMPAHLSCCCIYYLM